MFDVALLGPCKETLYSRTKDGHGCTDWKGRTTTDHRLTWCLARSLDPKEIEGLVVRHICDNPGCININHLEIGTHADNMRDKTERGRSAVVVGIKNPRARLTEKQVKEIRARSREHQELLAAEFGVSRTTIGAIITRQNWKHI